MLKMLLKCPNNFASADYIRNKLTADDKIVSFGLYSGYLEMDLFEKGHDITIYTNRYWTYEFWRCLANSPDSVVRSVEFFHRKLSVWDISQCRDKWFERFEDPYDRAGVYYLLNRYSKSGHIFDLDLSKHNFSRLNLSFLERHSAAAKKLKLFYVEEESPDKIFKQVPSDDVVLLPIGKFKRKYILEKKTQAIDSPTYDYEKLKESLINNEHRMIIVHKYDHHADKFYDRVHKTYINKFGMTTEKPELAEDLIVSNF